MPFSPLALLSRPLGTLLSCPKLGTNQGSQLISTSPSNCWPEPPISTDYNSSKNTLTALNFLLLSFCQYSSLGSLRILKSFSSGLFLSSRVKGCPFISPPYFSLTYLWTSASVKHTETSTEPRHICLGSGKQGPCGPPLTWGRMKAQPGLLTVWWHLS